MSHTHSPPSLDEYSVPPRSTPPPRAKSRRPKTNQACTSCRKHKTRCELLDLPQTGVLRCHRCNVLNISCSYEDMENPPFPTISPGASRASTARASPQPPFQLLGNAAADPNVSVLGPSLGADGHPKVEARALQFWSLVIPDHGHNLDWSAPMLAIQQMSRSVSGQGSNSIHAQVRHALSSIISQELMLHLLNIFDSHYTGWLNFAPPRTSNMPILDLARCLVATRHLESESREQVAPRIHTLVEQVICKIVLDPAQFESIECCQALLILSLWSPMSGSGLSTYRDSRAMIAVAGSMALNLRLNHASSRAIAVPQSPDSPDVPSAAYITDRARLWLSVANAESMICLGTGRIPSTRRSAADLRLFQPQYLSSLPLDGRDGRLRLTAELLETTERGTSLQLSSISISDVEAWYSAVSSVLESLDFIFEQISVIPHHEQFYWHMLKANYYYCRLLVLYHAIFEARYSCQQYGYFDAEYHIRPRQQPVLTIWSKESFQLAESFLRSIESIGPTSISPSVMNLSICPDNIYMMLGFTVGILIGYKIMVWTSMQTLIPGDSDRLVNEIASQLSRCAYASPADHVVHKTVQLVDLMISRWTGVRSNPHPPTPSDMDPLHSPAHPFMFGNTPSPHAPPGGEASSILFFDPDVWNMA